MKDQGDEMNMASPANTTTDTYAAQKARYDEL